MSNCGFSNDTVNRLPSLAEVFNLTTGLDSVLDDLTENTAKHKFVVWVDGSGSMVFEAPPSWGTPYPKEGRTLEYILKSIASLQNDADTGKTSIDSNFWGELKARGGIRWHKNGSLQEAENIEVLKNGLGSGTDLAPAAAEMAALAKQVENTRTHLHFVLVTDGEIVDPKKAKPVLMRLLSAEENRRVTLDFILTSRFTSVTPAILSLATELREKFPARVGAITTLGQDEYPETALKEVVKNRGGVLQQKALVGRKSPKSPMTATC